MQNTKARVEWNNESGNRVKRRKRRAQWSDARRAKSLRAQERGNEAEEGKRGKEGRKKARQMKHAFLFSLILNSFFSLFLSAYHQSDERLIADESGVWTHPPDLRREGGREREGREKREGKGGGAHTESEREHRRERKGN